MAKDWCASCQNNSKDYDDIICVMCVWQEEDNDNLPPTNYIYKPQTNADRVRAMSDEELAGVLAMQGVVSPPWCSENYDCPYVDQDPVRCDLCALDWLKQEAKE